jgi:hypothetical protein
MDHIRPYESGVIVRAPGGASRFQYPGSARPQGRYIPPAALFFWRWIAAENPEHAVISQAGDLRFAGIDR